MTFRIQFEGIVQGVGFRPMVFALAQRLGFTGCVSNSSEGVEILLNADSAKVAEIFCHEIERNKPVQCVITAYQIKEITQTYFEEFRIVASVGENGASALLTPDYAICQQCREELHTPINKREHYPFITCTQCGPRYSIIDRLPYERHSTSMRMFDMCEECGTEYNNATDRRFYAETNSCAKCGITLTLFERGVEKVTGLESLSRVDSLLADGKIVAAKGIGGYLLLCDATSASAVKELRKRKHRPTKPFAVLFKEIESVRAVADLTTHEESALQSFVSPIVLVRLKKSLSGSFQRDLIAPSLYTVGAMLPNAPLLELIAHKYGKPLIATSANVSNSPILYKDNNEAIQELQSIADAILVHNREILIPQDDSVVRFANGGRNIIVRRSRGMAPTFISKSFTHNKTCLLGMGAHLKSSLALHHKGNFYVSQYLGDLQSFDVLTNYQVVLHHFLKITGATPELILVDAHPDYPSTQLGHELAAIQNVSIEKVQHHHAHFAAVLAENNMIKPDRVVGGIIWDGTGLGLDGQAWGGEFFCWDGCVMNRVSSIDYFPLIMGDKMAKEPRLSALSLLGEKGFAVLENKFINTEANLFLGVRENAAQKTSSMGRLFDAIASICGLCDVASYEGEAALLLESAASNFAEQNSRKREGYSIVFKNNRLDAAELARAIAEDVLAGRNVNEIAFNFHVTLVKFIRAVAKQNNVTTLALSGGVFQNALLVSLIEDDLKNDHQLCFHQQLSPNDECISFGQIAYWQMMGSRSSKNENRQAMAEVIN